MKKCFIIIIGFILMSCSAIDAPHGGTVGSQAIMGDALKSYVENTCVYCDGTGRKECIYCDGMGRKECYGCRGSGLGMMCSLCDGSGRTYSEYFGWSKCYSCGGRGYSKCYSCRGTGQQKCGYCNGRGWEKCNWCKGTGYR